MSNMRYIYVVDEDAKKYFTSKGYQIFKKQDNGIWIFINKDINTFEFSGNDGVVYSNSVTF